jgi:cell division protein ZapE
MTPIEIYQQQLNQNGFTADAHQREAIQHLQRLYADLLAEQNINGWQKFTTAVGLKKAQPVRGVYLWGSVGVGKTWLMDIFYQALPIEKKLRMHFHRFMQFVHQELQLLQGHPDPLKDVAKDFAKQADVICFDEFLVNDIADAMLLANLLKALFAENITLVTTANVEPDLLYRNGIQRGRFMPAITLLKEHLEVIHLPTEIDYRLQTHEQIGSYFYPLTAESAEHMQYAFKRLAQGVRSEKTVTIEKRTINVLGLAENIVWFDFHDLCNVPRSQLDYLAIAEQFSTVLLSNVPKIDAKQEDTVRYLINLIDVLYDAKTKLIVSAAVPVPDIYAEGRSFFEFKRTRSRLLEMQSREYLEASNRAATARERFAAS